MKNLKVTVNGTVYHVQVEEIKNTEATAVCTPEKPAVPVNGGKGWDEVHHLSSTESGRSR